jgi:hypothetical protein
LAVAGAYLLASRIRIRPIETIGVGASLLLAIWVTPALAGTGSYYWGVFNNEAARRGTELWAPPSLGNPFDVAMVVATIALLVIFGLRRRPLWEYVAVAGLVLASATAARNGVWLLMTLVAAAQVFPRASQSWGSEVKGMDKRFWIGVGMVVAASGAVFAWRGLPLSAPDDGPATIVAGNVRSQDVVLAPEPLAETLAVNGVRLWALDPIDAFESRDQAAYLGFLRGGEDAGRAVDGSTVVVVEESSPAAQMMAARHDFHKVRQDGQWSVYRRLGTVTP